MYSFTESAKTHVDTPVAFLLTFFSGLLRPVLHPRCYDKANANLLLLFR
jgi:hypothetical protein